ncbi:MAG: hypothetical protein K5857_07415 [Lachnospiraceae bacterium]|nr:hypothetical protein [Lachnospiraceae bacterium]
MSNRINKILNIVIIVLTVIIFCLAAYLLAETGPKAIIREPETAKSMIRRLEKGDYSGLVESKYLNEYIGATAGSDSAYKVPYAATDYYEAALTYNAYARTGDTGKASEYKKVMDESRKSLGEYEYLADEIDSFLK